jgi:hypothetical protein
MPAMPTCLSGQHVTPSLLSVCLSRQTVCSNAATPTCLLAPRPHLPVCLHLCHIYLSVCTPATYTCVLAPLPHLPICLHPCHIYLSACSSATPYCLFIVCSSARPAYLFVILSHLPIYFYFLICLFVCAFGLVTPIWFLATLSVRVLLHHTNLSGWTCHFGLSVPWLSIPMYLGLTCLPVSLFLIALFARFWRHYVNLSHCAASTTFLVRYAWAVCTMFRTRYQTQHSRNCTPNILTITQGSTSDGIFRQSMGARNRLGIGMLYRPARLHSLAELVLWNRFRAPKKSLKIRAQYTCSVIIAGQRASSWSKLAASLSSHKEKL